VCSRVMCTGLAPASAPKFHEVGYLRGGAAVRAGRSCASDGRRVSSDFLLRTIGNGARSIEMYIEMCISPCFCLLRKCRQN
jgi:hypothetical protein